MLDEPSSALDAAVQAQVLNLLLDLQETLKLTYIFVTHNISVARYVSDYIAVFYAGSIREFGPAQEVLNHPMHPYTSTLIDAFPVLNPSARTLLKTEVMGEPPSLISPPAGCKFHPRCHYARDVCKSKEPDLALVSDDHLAACYFAKEIQNQKTLS